MTATPYDEAVDPVAVKHARLASGVAGVRRRSGGFDMQRALLTAGSVLLPSGLIVILLGWFGAAHTSYDFEQTPYLISGGILGAAMTVAGGFLYFGYWLTRIVEESQRQRRELSELLIRLDNRLTVFEAVATGVLPGRPAQPSQTGPIGNGTAGAEFVATATGTMLHRRDCPLVQGKTGLRPVSRTEPRLRPCKVCQPLAEAGDEVAGTAPVSG